MMLLESRPWEPRYEDEEHPPQVCEYCHQEIEDGHSILVNGRLYCSDSGCDPDQQ